MKKTLAFIIPSYNVEWCLKRAIDSIVNSPCEKDVEIIIVNDGSQDQTVNIGKYYVEKYPRTVSLINKSNGGHGSAINAGTLQVSAKYFKVLDADDWIVTDNLCKFVSLLKVCHSDVVLTPFHLVDMNDQSKAVWKMYCETYEKEYSMTEVLENWKNFERCLSFHGITYRTEFYTMHRHELPEGVFFEDQEYSAIPCCYAESIYPIDLFIYQYQIGNAEQSVSDKNQIKRISHIQKVAEDMLMYLINNHDLSDAGEEYIRRKAEVVVLSYYVVACLLRKNKRKGRREAVEFNHVIEKLDSSFHKRTKSKYILYLIMNYMHISKRTYQKIISSKLYSILRKTHRIEKEL